LDDKVDAINTISLGTDWTDQVGNPGVAVTSANYEIESLRPTGNFTISVAQGTSYTNTTSTDSALKPGDNATLTLVFSEKVKEFSNADLTVPNGTLTAMTSSDNITWTGNLTPSDDIADITNSIGLGTQYKDIAGNRGASAINSDNYVVDTKAPSVSSITPVNDTCIPITADLEGTDYDNIAVTFNFHMGPSYMTTSTSDTNCAGSMRVSSDNFSTCVQMSAEPTASNVNRIFTLNPSDNLSYDTTYSIAVTTAAKSILGNALSSQYDSSFITSPAPSSVSGLFMAVGQNGEILRSADNGSSWVIANCQFIDENDFLAVTFGNNNFMAVGYIGLMRKSTDTGANFSTTNTGSTNRHLYGVSFGNNTFVAVGRAGKIMRSTDDGSSFSSVDANITYYLYGITFGNNTYVAVGNSGRILRSNDNGTSWNNATSPITSSLYGVTFGNNTFVAVGQAGKIVRSTDNGTSWDNATNTDGSNLWDVTFGNDTFVAVGNRGKILKSIDDGDTFAVISSPTSNVLNSISFGNNTFVAVGDSGEVVRSTDNGTSWNIVTSPITTILKGVTFSE